MKYEVQISRLAVVCVLCASAVSGAFGAASVRSLGGAGTYSGTSAASTGRPSGAINAVRAGSMRVTPSAKTTSASSSNKGTTTTGRVASSPRLSIGKYLGGGVSVSGGSSIKNQKPGASVSGGTSGSMNPGVAADFESRIVELEGQVNNNIYVKEDMDSMLADKQNVLTPVDGYIVIDRDEIYLDVDKLQDNLEVVAGQDGREVEIGTNDTHLLWRYNGDAAWQELIALDAIRGATGATGEMGPQGPAGEKGEKGDKGDKGDPGEAVDTSIFPTKEFMNTEIAKAIANANYVTSADLATELATKADVSALADKADKTALAAYATKTGVEESIINATADLATTAAMNTALAGKADAAAVNTALAGKADVGASYTKTESDAKYLTEHQSLADYAKSADVAATYATKTQLDEAVIEAGNIDLTSYAKTADVDSKLATKADKTALDDLATKEELAAKADATALAGKADTTTVTVLAGRVDTAEEDIAEVSATATAANTAATNAGVAATAAATAASEAATLASAAKSAADTAKSAADTAKTTADGAKTAADSATTIANAAKMAADNNTTALAAKADKATTLAGYGITDAYTKAEVETKIAEAGVGDIDLTSYAKTEDVNTALANKADKTALDSLATKSELTTGLAAKADASALDDLATKEELAAKADATALAAKANTSDLGTLAYKNTISNADVADDAAIAKGKLASDVQASLTKADQAVSTADAPTSGDYVLAVSNGQKGWFEVVTEQDSPAVN